MKNKIRFIDILFRSIIIITLIANIAYLFFLQRQPTNDDIFGHLFEFLISISMTCMIIITEIEIYFMTKYFLKPKEDRRKYKTVINTICPVTWILIVFFCFVGFTDLLVMWPFYFIIIYLPLRILYALIGISKQKHKN